MLSIVFIYSNYFDISRGKIFKILIKININILFVHTSYNSLPIIQLMLSNNYYSRPSIAKLVIKQVGDNPNWLKFFPFTRLYLPIHGTSVRTKRLSKQEFFVPVEMIICEKTPFIFNLEGSYFFFLFFLPRPPRLFTLR